MYIQTVWKLLTYNSSAACMMCIICTDCTGIVLEETGLNSALTIHICQVLTSSGNCVTASILGVCNKMGVF